MRHADATRSRRRPRHTTPATRARRTAIAALPAATVALALVLAAAIAGCDVLRLAPFSVAACAPAEGYLADPAAAVIRVEFSAAAERESAERAFSLRSESETIYGAFEWADDRAFAFRPWKAIEAGHDYKIVVSTAAEDGTGISLEREFTRRFTTRLDRERPRVLGSDPADGGVLAGPLAPLRIELSEAVDEGNFLSAASINPAIQGAWSFPAPDPAAPRYECVFTPSAEWAQKTDYTLGLATSYTDPSGNALLEGFKSSFAYSSDAADATPPALLAVACVGKAGDPAATLADRGADGGHDPGWERDWGMTFAWSEEVDVKAFLGALAFEPPARFEPDLPAATARPAFAASVAIRFPDGLEREQLYKLSVKEGVKDRAGNAMPTAAVRRFRVDGPRTVPPALERVDFPSDPGAAPDCSFTLAEAYSASKTIPLSAAEYAPSGSSGWVDVYVSTAAGAGFSPRSFMDSFRIDLDNLGGSATVWKVATDATLDAPGAAYATPPPLGPPPVAAVRTLVRVRAFFYLNYDAAKNGAFRFGLRAGFADGRGSATAADIALPVIVAAAP